MLNVILPLAIINQVNDIVEAGKTETPNPACGSVFMVAASVA